MMITPDELAMLSCLKDKKIQILEQIVEEKDAEIERLRGLLEEKEAQGRKP